MYCMVVLKGSFSTVTDEDHEDFFNCLFSVLQHKLEGALLALGQFQHALDELLAWLTHTEGLLNEQRPASGDPKAIEIELAKHHVSRRLRTLLRLAL